MILLIFEGVEREPHIYRTMEKLYFPRANDNIICSFGNNIYELYKEMTDFDGDGDIVSIMRERLALRGDSILDGIRSSDVSEIFLFFDYDFQIPDFTLEEVNERVKKMLELFTDETGAGKLYINYPMIESIRHTKELPDEELINYVATREECKDYKHLVGDFSYYDSFDHILFRDNEKPTREKYHKIADNWQYLQVMNVTKANYLITGQNTMPPRKSLINQQEIFIAQKRRYVDINESVAVLNSFPIFIYEYLK